ncbi:glucoamylase family protein [Athalassotoga sp.]|uniref:glucoamylase family protein n=1 Tax=Athalassotoga sp. TaxID=2022597 RepID=UPI003D08861F
MKKLFVLFLAFLLIGGIAMAQDNPDEIFAKNERDAAFYFWNEVNPSNGLVRDRTTWDSPSSIAAVGFGLTSLCIAADHGWIPQQDVYDRILTTLEYFKNLPNEHGFYYHFLNLWTGQRASGSEVSPIDTTLFIAGALFAGQYFPGTEVQKLADELYERIDWQWMTNNTAYLDMAWYPENGFSKSYWTGYSEAALMYILAIGSPTYPISPQDWGYWIVTWSQNGSGNLKHWASSDESMFTYLYSQAYINFKDLNFKYVGNLWDNSEKAIEYDMQFANENSQYRTFKEGFWGLSACDGPGGYEAYGAIMGGTDGTVAPYAMIGALPFTPNRSKAAVLKMWTLKNELYGRYGFVDAFNLDQNWRDFDYIGIDVGIEVLMTENYYTGMVWKYFMQVPFVQKAIELIGPEVTKPSGEQSQTEPQSQSVQSTSYTVVESFSSPYGKYGLGPWTGGTSSASDVNANIVSDSTFGHAWKINFNVQKSGAYNGTWIDLANTNLNQTFDASPYSAIVFYVKGSNPSMNFKIELKSPNNGVEYYYVNAGTEWTKVVVPFSKMSVYTWTKPVDFSRLIQMTFVFENNVDSIKEGTIYVARIGFS